MTHRMEMKILQFKPKHRSLPPLLFLQLFLVPPPAPHPFLPNGHQPAQIKKAFSLPTKPGSINVSMLLATSFRVPLTQSRSPRLCSLLFLSCRRTPLLRPSPRRQRPTRSSRLPAAQLLKSCHVSPPPSKVLRRSSPHRTTHPLVQTTAAWQHLCLQSLEGLQGWFPKE